MSKILSYSDNTTGAGWIAKDPYSGDDIAKITDPNGDAVEYPRTSIPSPFARVDLVATAFATLAASGLKGAAMHHRLVSDALDVAQLLFNYSAFADRVRLLRWHPARSIERMKAEGGDHALLADTLRLYMESDSEAYNFNLEDPWYILTYQNRVIGSTSPATYTMGAPLDSPLEELLIEEGTPLFSRTVRHLWQRDDDFVVYMVHWFNAWPEARRRLKAVYDYILVNLEQIRTRKPALYARVTARVENPHALRSDVADSLAASLESAYSAFDTDVQPRVLGMPLFMRRDEDMLRGPAESDFMLVPSLPQPEGERLPLVLRQGFTSPGTEPFVYINRPWTDSTPVDTAGLEPDERILPGTSVAYPWITDTDLLEDAVIELATPVDSAHFFNGNLTKSHADSSCGFLLPVKPLFFKYFPASFLTGNVAPGRKALEMRHSGETLTVTLRVPVKKGYVEQTRTYRRPGEAGGADGLIVPETRVSVGVFPFVRTGLADIYNVRLFEMLSDARASLSFYADARTAPLQVSDPVERTASRAMRTAYYEVDYAWDYARLQALSHNGRERHQGVMLPLWPEYEAGPQRHVFAVDFGTTNSHVEYSVDDSPARPLEFAESSAATLVATLDAPGSLAQADTLLDVEFVPRNVGDAYGFPMRTALARNLTSSAVPRALMSINIPFLYERKAFNGYKVSTMLKWSDDTRLSEQFLREIMMMIRARVLLDNASPANTRIVYFYPVSMGRSLQNRYMTLWENLYMRYLDPHKADVTAFPESVAPAFFYSDSTSEGSDYVSIDIGGGSSDVVVYRSDDEGLTSDPALISSFRFAGNALFGDAFEEADADHNPMLRRYLGYFSRMLNADPALSYLDVILADIAATKRSRDISAALFSIENAPALKGLSALDRAPYSFNTLLRDDSALKPVFVYFYTALIYYVARLMRHAGIGKPRKICFSGTGSKVLNILGRPDLVQDYTRHILSHVWNEEYSSSSPFTLSIERDAPKQVTCKGGIVLERRLRSGQANPAIFTPRHIMACKDNYTLTSSAPYTNATLRSRAARLEVEQAVRDFNSEFLAILDKDWREEFGIGLAAGRLLAESLDKDIAPYMTAAVNALVPREAADDEAVEDVPFFYPIIGIIRHTLIPALCDLKD